MTEFALIDVKDIKSDVPRSEFSEPDIESLADLILSSGGIIRPLILKQIGVDSYAIIDGHLEYYAAVRAKEKNARQGELVNAFVVAPKQEDEITEQLKILEGNKTPPGKGIPSPEPSDSTLGGRVTNIELRLERYINQLREERAEEKRSIEARLKHLEGSITQKVDPLEAINTLSQDELALKLARSRIPSPEKLAKTICDARRRKPQEKFDGYSDLVKSVKGLGEKRVLTIIDDWSRS